ncbi:MAG: endonuclease Q family protein [Candidatus Paceibacterota bacterium]|jgi:uncharacterized protein (TIGR00375 family)
MEFIADLHIHSKYSRATSSQMELEPLDQWAKIKGIQVLGTGDFTHPLWFANLVQKLEPAEPGLFILKNDKGDFKNRTRFLLTSEISCIYTKNGKVRKIHIVFFAPSFETVAKINKDLAAAGGNLKSDGRPILGLDAEKLVEIVLNADPKVFVVPAHIYTPWFSLFGSRSGFDSLEECFEGYSKYIYAGETGLSSDPAMSWRNSKLDKLALISSSDAHSPAKLGREATVFDTELSYEAITGALKEKDPKKFLYTVEFYPEEGKYHYDGHRECNISLSPAESKKYNNICPVCGRPLTIGVLNRATELADRPQGFKPENAIPFKSLVPLQEIIAESLGVGVVSKKVGAAYDKMIKEFGSEFNILLKTPIEDMSKTVPARIAEGVEKARNGQLSINPGYDGVFGKIKIFSEKEKNNSIAQKKLF